MRATKWIAGTAALVLASGLVPSAAQAAVVYEDIPFTDDELSNWVVDRAVPSGGYESIDDFAGRDDVLEIRIESDSRSDDGQFYWTEGLKRGVEQVDALRVDLFVDEGWLDETPVRAGLWGVAVDAAGTVVSYPIIEFTTAGVEGFTGWRFWDGAEWHNLDDVDFSPGEWVTLELVLDAESVAVLLDGVTVAEIAADGAVAFGDVILNSYNYGPTEPDYSVHWSALGLGEFFPDPVSADDCKKGGYADFGFKNQGQCVASVRANANSGH